MSEVFTQPQFFVDQYTNENICTVVTDRSPTPPKGIPIMSRNNDIRDKMQQHLGENIIQSSGVDIPDYLPENIENLEKNENFSASNSLETSFELGPVGVIRSRRARLDDIPYIRDNLYAKVHLNTGNIDEIMDKNSKRSYERSGSITSIPSAEELTELIENGLLLLIEHEEKIIASFSCYTFDLYKDLLDAYNKSSSDDAYIYIDRLPSLDKISTVENKPLKINKKSVFSMLREAAKKGGKIFWALDVLVDPKFQRMGVASFLEGQIYVVLRQFYNCLYFLDDIYDINYYSKNGKIMRDEEGNIISMENKRSKRLHRDIMQGVEIGTKEDMKKVVEKSVDPETGDILDDHVEISISSGIWGFSIETVLKDLKFWERYNKTYHGSDIEV